MSTNTAYYIPHKANWPVIGTAGLVTMLAGFANYLNGSSIGPALMVVGLLIFITMLVGWFTLQATESETGMYNHEVGISFLPIPTIIAIPQYIATKNRPPTWRAA